MAKLEINLSGRGGLAPKYFGDMNDTSSKPERLIIAKDNQMADGIYNVLRNHGYLSAAPKSFKTITGAPAEVFTCSISDLTSQDAYFGELGTKMWGLGDATDTSLTTHATITGASYTDLEIYQVNGVKKLFYAYQKAGGGDIGIANIPFASNDDDWLSTIPTGALNTGATNDVIMTVADNGFMYIMDGYAVHKFDGTTNGGAGGRVSANALLFPTTFTIVDSLDFRGNLYIAIQTSALLGVGSTSSEGANTIGVYIWDRLTNISKMRDFIPLLGVKEIRKLYVSPDGEVRVIVINNDRFVEIRRFNGSYFETVVQLGLNAYPYYRDSVTYLGGFTIWLGSDGILYAHGKVLPGEGDALFKIGDTSSVWSTAVVTGAILLYYGNQSPTTPGQGIVLSFRDSSARYVRRFHPYGTGTIDSISQLADIGNIYTPVRYLPQMSTVNHLDIYHAPGTSGTTATNATLKIYFNQSTTAWASKVITKNDVLRGYTRIEINEPYINAIQLEIEYAGQELSDTYDFRPSTAILDYSPTKTKG